MVGPYLHTVGAVWFENEAPVDGSGEEHDHVVLQRDFAGVLVSSAYGMRGFAVWVFGLSVGSVERVFEALDLNRTVTAAAAVDGGFESFCASVVLHVW